MKLILKSYKKKLGIQSFIYATSPIKIRNIDSQFKFHAHKMP
jgi:hypothetical protein